MNATTNATTTMTHEGAMELLPWLANETLGDEQKAQVEAHVQACVACRRELSFLRRVQTGIQGRGDAGLSLQRGLTSVLNRIDAQEGSGRHAPVVHWWRRGGIAHNPRALQLAVAAQAACIGGLLWWALGAQSGQGDAAFTAQSMPADYQTLSNAGTSDYQLWVRFTPQLNIAQLNALLQAHGATIMEGPRANDVYRVRLDSQQMADALSASPQIAFAVSGPQGLAQQGLGE